MKTRTIEFPPYTLQQVNKFAKGTISLGQLAQESGKYISETAQLLAIADIPVLDYDLTDELDTLANLTPNNLHQK